VADDDCQKRFNPAMTEQIIRDGYSFRADTLEGLAKILKEKFNMPEDVFLKSIAEYNEMVKKGKDEAFGKKPTNLKPIEKAPFYASPTQAGVHHTMGGLRTKGRPARCSTGTGRSSPGCTRRAR
jgi:fumarate reductase flavoprotein subunit